MNSDTILLIILACIILYFIYTNYKTEYFGSAGGTLIQLMAKGPQDVYLTGDQLTNFNCTGTGENSCLFRRNRKKQ